MVVCVMVGGLVVSGTFGSFVGWVGFRLRFLSGFG